MRIPRRFAIVPVTVALVVATGACAKSADTTTAPTSAPSTAPGSTPPTTPGSTPKTTSGATPGTTAGTTTAVKSPSTSATPTTATSATPKANEVVIKDFLFGPDTLTVKAGTEVVWTNADEFDHWVLADDKTSFDSNRLAQGATYAHTFATPGSYPYFCNIHNQMKGTIVVS